MEAYYFTFQSLTQAQTAAAVLQRHGLPAVLVRAQKAMSVRGCGYAVRVSLTDAYAVNMLLRNAGVFPLKILRILNNGETREVFL